MKYLSNISLFMALASLGTASVHAQATDFIIDFEAPAGSDGTEATNLYVSQGIRFPSRPRIESDGRNLLLVQGTVRRDGPDPLPTDVLCAPIEIELAPAMNVRQVGIVAINRHLRGYSVIGFSGATEVDRNQYFAPSDPRRPPLPPQRRDVALSAEASEGGITRVRVNPPADCFDLARIDNLRVVTAAPVVPIDPVDLPSTNRVYASHYEVTQGVMSSLTASTVTGNSPDTRLMALPTKRLTFVENRDTVIRYFLNATETDVASYGALLDVTAIYKDGTRRTRRIAENSAGGATVPFVDRSRPDDELRRERYARRARLDQSHDYVIPARFLANAQQVQVELQSPDGTPMSRAMFDLVGPYRQAVNFWRVRGIGPDAAVAGPPPRPTGSLAIQFMRELYPISGGIQLRENGVLTMAGDATGNSQTGSCWTFLRAMDSAVAGTAGATAPTNVNYWTNMYMLTNTPPDCGGLGWYNTPGALTNQNFSTAAHELGHNIGLNHVTGQHGEPADRETWPLLHGSIGTPDEGQGWDDGVFGMVVISSTPGRDEIVDWGQWNLTVIPPCQAPLVQVFPTCTATPDGQLAHDYMSYGPSTNAAPFGAQTWISDINYYRLLRFYEDCVVTDPPNRFNSGSTALATTAQCSSASGGAGSSGSSGGAGGAARDAFVISGVIDNGRITDLEAIRKLAIVPQLPQLDPQQAIFLVARGVGGQVISEAPVQLRQAPGEVQQDGAAFTEIIPFSRNIARIDVMDGQRRLGSLERRGPVPVVTLLSPRDGDVWTSGKQTIRWRSRDLDAAIYVQYSPDGGKSWNPVALVGGRQNSVEIDVGDLTPSNDGRFYISATRGLASAISANRRAVIIGQGGNASSIQEDCLGHDLSRLAVRQVGGRWKIVQGNRLMFDFGSNEDEARAALAVMQRFGFDETCYVGRPDPAMTYFKSRGSVSGGSSSGLDCIAFDPDLVTVSKERSHWLLSSGRSRMRIFDNEAEAQQAKSLIGRYQLNRQCFVGRPDPSFTYWLSR